MSVSAWWDLFGGVLTTDWRHNYNEQDVSNVQSGAINEGRVYDLENQVPENSSVLTFDYNREGFGGLIRVNYYDEWSSTDGLFGPPDASTAYTYDDAVLVDIEASYTFADRYTVAVGGENIFDEYPEDENGFVASEIFGVEYALTSPFGFNGAFWYARLSASF